MGAHIDASSAKRDTLGLQAETLFGGGISAKLDFAPGPDDAVPGQIKRPVQGSDDLAGRPRISGCFRDCPIGGDMTARHAPDCLYNTFAHAAWHGQTCYLICRFLAPVR